MQLFEKTLGDFLEYWAEKTPDKPRLAFYLLRIQQTCK